MHRRVEIFWLKPLFWLFYLPKWLCYTSLVQSSWQWSSVCLYGKRHQKLQPFSIFEVQQKRENLSACKVFHSVHLSSSRAHNGHWCSPAAIPHNTFGQQSVFNVVCCMLWDVNHHFTAHMVIDFIDMNIKEKLHFTANTFIPLQCLSCWLFSHCALRCYLFINMFSQSTFLLWLIQR